MSLHYKVFALLALLVMLFEVTFLFFMLLFLQSSFFPRVHYPHCDIECFVSRSAYCAIKVTSCITFTLRYSVHPLPF